MITLPKLTPYTGDIVAPSPNHGDRKAQAIEGIVLHATEDAGNETRSLSWMRSPKSRVSCHLLVSRNGRATRLVGDQQRAWHAGVSWWRGTSDVNSITLGIEIANRNDGEPYTDAQYARVAEIVAHYCRQGLSLDDVVSHGEIAPGRRTDPLGWDWDRFRAMVQQQLRAPDVDGIVYDRRSAERRAADDAAGYRAPNVQATAPGDSAMASAATDRRIAAAPKRKVPAVTMPTQRAPVTTAAKPVLQSRTLWLNGLTVLTAGAAIAGESLKLAFGVGLTLPEGVTKWVLFVVGLVNIFLRLRTTQPLTCSEGVDCSHPDPRARVPRREPARHLGGAAAGQR